MIGIIITSHGQIAKELLETSKMFFGEKGGISLDEIYSQVFQIEEEMSYGLAKDVMRKFVKSKRTFEDVEGEGEREYLQMFSFIAMLSFDVYLKRNLIESIVDDVLDGNEKGKDEV